MFRANAIHTVVFRSGMTFVLNSELYDGLRLRCRLLLSHDTLCHFKLTLTHRYLTRLLLKRTSSPLTQTPLQGTLMKSHAFMVSERMSKTNILIMPRANFLFSVNTAHFTFPLDVFGCALIKMALPLSVIFALCTLTV